MSELRKTYPGGLFFITLSVVGWIDIFTRHIYTDEVLKNLSYCQRHKGLQIYAWVMMSNHMHLVVSNEDNSQPLSDTLRDFKSYTAKRILSLLQESPVESRKEWLLYMFRYFGTRSPANKEFQFWQHTNHATELYDEEILLQKIEYIHMNPVKARIVEQAEQYVYSSAHPAALLKLAEWK